MEKPEIKVNIFKDYMELGVFLQKQTNIRIIHISYIKDIDCDEDNDDSRILFIYEKENGYWSRDEIKQLINKIKYSATSEGSGIRLHYQGLMMDTDSSAFKGMDFLFKAIEVSECYQIK